VAISHNKVPITQKKKKKKKPAGEKDTEASKQKYKTLVAD